MSDKNKYCATQNHHMSAIFEHSWIVLGLGGVGGRSRYSRQYHQRNLDSHLFKTPQTQRFQDEKFLKARHFQRRQTPKDSYKIQYHVIKNCLSLARQNEKVQYWKVVLVTYFKKTTTVFTRNLKKFVQMVSRVRNKMHLSNSGHRKENEGWFQREGRVWSGLTSAKGNTGLLLFESEVKILFFKCKSCLTLIV